MSPLEVSLCEEMLLLDHRRAMIWPRQRWLLIADLHLGKASTLRQSGMALPRGTTTQDLHRLSDLVQAHAPHRLVVLGDLIHAAEPVRAEWLDRFAQWRAAHSTLALSLIVGNHDRHLTDAGLGFERLDELHAPPFVLRHIPVPHPTLHVLAGHVHPGVKFCEGRLRHRLPAFWLGAHRTVLPAFGSLTGLAACEARRDDRVFATTPGGMLDLTQARP